jgi:MinD superfamily P-loop ATPase
MKPNNGDKTVATILIYVGIKKYLYVLIILLSNISAIDGIIVVTSPQELVSMIVSKAVKMAELMNIPIIGLVENMSYFRCPDNGKDYQIFGDSHIEEIAKEHNLKVLAKIPIDPKISSACDDGKIEHLEGNWLDPIGKMLEKME